MNEYLNKSNYINTKISEFTETPAPIKRGQQKLPEKTSLSADEILEIEQAAEFLEEQVESLQQELQYESQLVDEYHQELLRANYEMSIINSELQDKFGLEKLKLAQAKLLAQRILSSQKSTSESLAELLSAIYNVLVTADQLEQVYMSGDSPLRESGVEHVD